jgi:hypothetical protein
LIFDNAHKNKTSSGVSLTVSAAYFWFSPMEVKIDHRNTLSTFLSGEKTPQNVIWGKKICKNCLNI